MAKKSKIILIATVVFAASAAIAVPVAIHHYSEPNFAKMNPQQIRAYFDSNQFRDANEGTRRQIGEQMMEAMQARMENQVNGYFAQPEELRTAYLDNIIDEMQARRAEFMNGRDPNRPFDPNRFRDPNRPRDPNRMARFAQRGQNAGQRPRPNPERMRERSSRTSADSRVKMAQFQRALSDRMEQRGIQGPMMGRGGFGGPGGGGFGGPGGGRGFGGPPNQ